MRITVVHAPEARPRQRFVSLPLKLAGHDVDTVKTKPLAGFLSRLLRFRRAEPRPDLIILMAVRLRELMVCQVGRMIGVPVVARLGGNPVRDLDSIASSFWSRRSYWGWLKCRLNIALSRMTLRRIDGAILVNVSLVEELTELLAREIPTPVVPQFCGGDPEPHSYALHDPIELLTVTNLLFADKAQGVLWIVRQLSTYVLEHEVAINYRVLGDGLHMPVVREYLAQNKLPAALNVVLEGFAAKLDLWYSRADALLYHSTHDATPNVVLESKRYGLPLLINDTRGFRTLVRPGVSALIYGNRQEFLRGLADILWSQGRRQELGRAAQEDLEANFTVGAVQRRLENAVASLVAEPAPSSTSARA